MMLLKRLVLRFLTAATLEGELLQFGPTAICLNLQADSDGRGVNSPVRNFIFFQSIKTAIVSGFM